MNLIFPIDAHVNQLASFALSSCNNWLLDSDPLEANRTSRAVSELASHAGNGQGTWRRACHFDESAVLLHFLYGGHNLIDRSLVENFDFG